MRFFFLPTLLAASISICQGVETSMSLRSKDLLKASRFLSDSDGNSCNERCPGTGTTNMYAVCVEKASKKGTQYETQCLEDKGPLAEGVTFGKKGSYEITKCGCCFEGEEPSRPDFCKESVVDEAIHGVEKAGELNDLPKVVQGIRGAVDSVIKGKVSTETAVHSVGKEADRIARGEVPTPNIAHAFDGLVNDEDLAVAGNVVRQVADRSNCFIQCAKDATPSEFIENSSGTFKRCYDACASEK